jgi:DNA-binding CsgD family transcriptional regulator
MPTNDAAPFHLTLREQQILRMICDGHSTKQIAYLLGVSHKTISCHRGRLLSKAHVHDTISLFRWALENRHVSLVAGADDTKGADYSIEQRRKPPSADRELHAFRDRYKNGGDPATLSHAAGAH